MMSNIFLASLLLLHALCSSLPNARPTLSQDTPTTVLFGPALTSFDLPSNDAWNGAALVGPALASSSNPDWPEASCGPNDAYGYLAGVRRCADFLIKEVPSHQCNSVDHLDGWGALHCANRGGDGSLTAAVQSWSRTNVSQVNTWWVWNS
jgi:hypothetical protein